MNDEKNTDGAARPGATRLVALVCMAQVLAQIGAYTWPALLPEFIPLWGLDYSQAGWITASFYLTYMLTVPILVSSSLLFYLGILFAYFIVFPVIFAFFTSTAPEGVLVMTDINEYLSFVLKLFFAFGLAFEVPVATVLMVRMGMTTPENLATKRPYIIVGAFVVGMVMTPPDIFSQTMLAIPVWILFEAGLYFSRTIKPRERDPEENDTSDLGGESMD